MPKSRVTRSKAAAQRPSAATRARSSSSDYAAPRRADARPAARPPAKTVEIEAAPRPLTASQKRYLRGFAHDLKAVVLVGQKGVTPALLQEFEGALSFHELVKVKLADDDRELRAASIESLRAGSGAELVQSIGKVACFYKRNPDKSQFTLPK